MLRTIIAPALLAVLLLAIPASAQAFFMTCADARELERSEADAGAVVGHSFGALDTYAGLLCFVGDPKCECLADAATNQPRAFTRVFERLLSECGDAEPVFGVALRAADALCAS